MLGVDGNLLHAVESFSTGIDGDGTGIDGATYQHAVDATLYGQGHGTHVVIGDVLLVGGVQQTLIALDVIDQIRLVVTGSDATNPTAFAHQREVDETVV